MRLMTGECENAIAGQEPQQLVDGTSQIARLANRVLQVAKQEADNSEDPAFIGRVTEAAGILQGSEFRVYRSLSFAPLSLSLFKLNNNTILRLDVMPMVQDARAVAINMDDEGSINQWRSSNKELLDSVGQVRQAVAGPDVEKIAAVDLSALNLGII